MKSRYFFPNVIVKKIILRKKYLLFFKYNLIIFPFKRSCIVNEKRIANAPADTQFQHWFL